MKSGLQLTYGVYRFLSRIYGKLALFHLQWRKRRGKEHEESILQKTGHYTLPRPEGRLIRLHGASVGESAALTPLIRELLRLDPTIRILLTTGTITSGKVIAAALTDRMIHQFAPLDYPKAVEKFYAHWRPDLEIYAESELWANAIFYAKSKNIPLFLVNGRMSAGSARRRAERAGRLTEDLLACFEKIYVQGYDNYRNYGLFAPNHRLQPTENLKWMAQPPPPSVTALQSLLGALQDRPCFCVMSVAPNEFAYFAERFLEVKARLPGALCVFTPRHPDKADEAEVIFQQKKLTTARRSLGKIPDRSTDIYIADTVGEASLWFALCPVTFMGKSVFSPGGGQNPIEPFYAKSVVITGKNTDNFTEIYRDAERFSCVIRTETPKETSDAIFYLLTHKELREKALQNAEALLKFKARGVKSDIADMARNILAVLRRPKR